MNQSVERRIREGHREQLLRLADQGERHGVRILVDHRTGEHVATSASDPTRCYHVDAERGCTCKGYAYWSRRQHWALLLAEMGQIVDADAVDCAGCQGKGWGEPWRVPGTDAYLTRCRTCDGKGWVPVASTAAEAGEAMVGDWPGEPSLFCDVCGASEGAAYDDWGASVGPDPIARCPSCHAKRVEAERRPAAVLAAA